MDDNASHSSHSAWSERTATSAERHIYSDETPERKRRRIDEERRAFDEFDEHMERWTESMREVPNDVMYVRGSPCSQTGAVERGYRTYKPPSRRLLMDARYRSPPRMKVPCQPELIDVHANRFFREDMRQLFKIKCATKLKEALEMHRANINIGIQSSVFCVDFKDTRMGTIKKRYWVASHKAMFNYAIRVDLGVVLYELIHPELRCRLHLDIEMKKKDVGTAFDIPLLQRGFESLLDIWNLRLDERAVKEVVRRYCTIVKEPFTLGECKAGTKLLVEFVYQFCGEALKVSLGENMWEIPLLSGCRPEKFSLHIIPNVTFDSSLGSMPLFVYELARHFSVVNVYKVCGHFSRKHDYIGGEQRLGQDELRFRLRAMMLQEAMVWKVAGETDEHTFLGFEDTPFDEGIYTEYRALRAPGACKQQADGRASGGMIPIAGESELGRLMVEERSFLKLFGGGRQKGNWKGGEENVYFDKWCKYLVNPPKADQSIVVTGMEMPDRFPFRGRWRHAVERLDLADSIRSEFWHARDDIQVIAYTGSRFVERRPCKWQEVIQWSGATTERNPHLDPALVIDWNTPFMSEAGVTKPFYKFAEGDLIRHDHRGDGNPEANASAKVFRACFRCYVCNKCYFVMQIMEEDRFEFRNGETAEATDESTWLEVDWKQHFTKKFSVISAPMGSGKTEQLGVLVNEWLRPQNQATIVVSFRQVLARQQAKRLGCACYDKVEEDAYREWCLGRDGLPISRRKFLEENPFVLAACRFLCVCLNSLSKVGDAVFDTVILDEFTLIRRHFLSSTMNNIEIQTYKHLKKLVRKARHVIMMEDGLTRDDVKFYTEMDDIEPEDRRHVTAQQLVKPVVIHPIEWTDNMYTALRAMMKRFEPSCFTEDGRLENPFMVFCSSAAMCVVIYDMLVDACPTPAAKNRVKLLIARTKDGDLKDESGWTSRFCEDANNAANEADVIVASSVIGAGFSISRHFTSFFAFLFLNILANKEERQLVRRLRFIAEGLSEHAIRTSTMFIQKSERKDRCCSVATVMCCFQAQRRLVQIRANGPTLLDCPPISAMEELGVTIACERAMTLNYHEALWRKYGEKQLASAFQEIAPSSAEEMVEESRIKETVRAKARQRSGHIRSMVCQMDMEDITQLLATLETEGRETMDFIRLLEAVAVNEKYVVTCDKFAAVAKEVIKDVGNHFPSLSEKAKDTMLSTERPRWMLNCVGLVGLVERMLPSMGESVTSFWRTLHSKCHKSEKLTVAAYIFAMEAFIPVLEGTNQPYILEPGRAPFFQTLKLLHDHPQFAVDMKNAASTEAGSRAIQVILSQGSCKEKEIEFALRDCQRSRRLLCSVMSKVGLKLRVKAQRNQGTRSYSYVESPLLELTLAFCVPKLRRKLQSDILPAASVHWHGQEADLLFRESKVLFQTLCESVLGESEEGSAIEGGANRIEYFTALRNTRYRFGEAEVDENGNVVATDGSTPATFDDSEADGTLDDDGTSIGGILGLRDLRMLHAADLALERENQQQRYLAITAAISEEQAHRMGRGWVEPIEVARPRCRFINDEAGVSDAIEVRTDSSTISELSEISDGSLMQ